MNSVYSPVFLPNYFLGNLRAVQFCSMFLLEFEGPNLAYKKLLFLLYSVEGKTLRVAAWKLIKTAEQC